MPIVIVASERMKQAIEHISLELARTYRQKITSKVPELCQRCNIENAEEVYDFERIASAIGELASDPEKDLMFLEKFAYTQMFSFILENYIAARNMR
mmetsp:Transcript_32165/g.42622  ORF Transcript_32165/g.42622 Transcript_32165/m.42622 type:complete len:97 (+) Transcript_32165:285-575(+)